MDLPEHVLDRVVSNYYGAILSSKQVRFNKNAFKRIWLGKEQRYLNTKSKSLVGQFVKLPLLDGKVIQLDVEKVEMLLEGIDVVTYSGSVDGYPDSRFVFSIEDDVIYGDVKFDHYVYKLHTTEDNNPRQIMSEINPRLMPRDTEDDVSDLDKMLSEIPSETKSSNGGGNVRVLFLYASNVYNPHFKITTLMSDFNGIKASSGVSSQRSISSAGVQKINYTFTTADDCKDPVVRDMAANRFPFTNLDDDMEAAYADMSFLILNGPSGHSTCGSAGFLAMWVDKRLL